MKHLILLAAIFVLPSVGWAACPAAPVGSNQDRVIQMVAGADGQTQMAKEEITDATEEGAIVYDSTLKTLVVCDGTDWVALSGGGLRDDCGTSSRLEWNGTEWRCTVAAGPPAPTGCPTIGDVCSDGSVYAGLSPDGSVPMYTTAVDQGTFQWKTTDTTTAGANNAANGVANTDAMEAAGIAQHPAAQACRALGSNWYLPAFSELQVLHTNRTAIGGFDLSGLVPNGWYWSSYENSSATAVAFRFNNDGPIAYTKSVALSVRCVRK